jgi:signal transduction histidine kinase
MRALIIILFLWFIHVDSYAQSQASLPANQNSLNLFHKRIDLLNDKAQKIFLESPDLARKIAEKALFLSQNAKYSLGTGQSFLNIGQICWSQSYYSVSLFYLKTALEYLPQNKPLLLADCYNALGRTYAELRNYNQALFSLNKALLYAGHDKERLAEVYSERSFIYTDMGNYTKAIEDVNTSLQLNRAVNNIGNIAVLYGRLATIYKDKKDNQNAIAYDDTAYKMSIKTHNNRLRAKTYVDYAINYNQLHAYDIAIKYAQKGIALSDSIGVVDATAAGYRSLTSSYQLKKDMKRALAYQSKYINIQDSLNIIDKIKSTQLIQNYFALNSRINDLAQMERNNLYNQAKIKSKDLVIVILALSLALVIGLLYITYGFYKQKKQLSNQLQQQHEALLDQKQVIEVQTANLQVVNGLKDRLLAVIGHDLRTPLANLSNITGMFETDYLSPDEVHELMKTINPMIRGAELTLSNLVEWAGSHIKGRSVESSHVDLFLLGIEMEQTFTHALQQKAINFINEAYAGQSVLADENHIKVILRNLVSNAIKFTGNEGSITISTRVEHNSLIISVADNGKGMTTDEMDKLFSISTHFSHSGTSGERGTGIGLLLCKELVELNGGKLWVSSILNHGSTFSFNLPLANAYV